MLIPLLLALALGRVFCGWICPMNTLLEATDRVRGWLSRAGLVPNGGFRLSRSNKYMLLAALFLAAVVSGVSIFPYLMPQLQMGKEFFQLIYFRSFSWGIYFVGGLVLFELLLSRRGWCRYICPAGAFLSLLALPRALRVQKTANGCSPECRSCVDACPLSLEPHTGKLMMECSQCGVCLSRCEAGLLTFRWRGSMRLAISTGVILTFLVLASVASAHHIRGLPHYGYTENYPQNPVLERVVKHKQYYIYVNTYSFEGLEREKSDTPNDIQFYILIKNMKNGKSYTGPLEVEITRKDESAVYQRSKPDEEAIYRIRHSFEKRKGKCLLRIRFDGEDEQENARIKMKLN
jgi:ferredoxin